MKGQTEKQLRQRINTLEQIIITLLAHNYHHLVGGREWALQMIKKIEDGKVIYEDATSPPLEKA